MIGIFFHFHMGTKGVYAALTLPAWLSLTQDGILMGTPSKSDVGVNSFVIQVTNENGVSSILNVKITVIHVSPPIFWLQDPIDLGITETNSLFQFDLSEYATDVDGDPLIFRLVQGPSWMSMIDNGLVFGAPSKADVGDYVAVFEVSKGQISAQVAAYGIVKERIESSL